MVQDSFDVTRKFVRVMGTLPNGFVEFEFAIGEPDVCVELVMPQAAFDEFCRNNQVELIGACSPPVADTDDADFHWSLRQATQQRFR